MKGKFLTRKILIVVPVLVLAGCAQMVTTPTGQPIKRANVKADAIITYVRNELHHVTPVAPGKRGNLFTWRIVPDPPGYKTRVCFDKGDPSPFTDPKWNDGCEDGTVVITGTLKNDINLPREGYLDINYSVLEIKNNIKIDPIIRVY